MLQTLICILFAFVTTAVNGQPQQVDNGGFTIRQLTDSTSVLVLDYNGHHDEWKLNYPTYQFVTTDLNDDGIQEALVGVIKATRFFKQPEKRLFIYKNHYGRIRPLWMGSKVGKRLLDFTARGNKIICITESSYIPGPGSTQTTYDVPVLKLSRFGLDFIEYKATNITEQQARLYLEND